MSIRNRSLEITRVHFFGCLVCLGFFVRLQFLHTFVDVGLQKDIQREREREREREKERDEFNK